MIDRETYYHSSLECSVKPGDLLTDFDLLRAQRIEMTGRLATSIAHDLSNTLSTMRLLMRSLPREQIAAEHKNGLESSQFCAERAAQLISQLLSLARDVEEQPTPVNVRQLIMETVGVVRNTFPKTISLKVTISPNLPSVGGNTTHLYQVLLNLCLNARDAMPSGGTLSIKANNVCIDSVAARSFSEAEPGNYVVIQVTDTGTGIPAAIVGK